MIELVVARRSAVRLFQWCRWLLYYLYANVSYLGECVSFKTTNWSRESEANWLNWVFLLFSNRLQNRAGFLSISDMVWELRLLDFVIRWKIAGIIELVNLSLYPAGLAFPCVEEKLKERPNISCRVFITAKFRKREYFQLAWHNCDQAAYRRFTSRSMPRLIRTEARCNLIQHALVITACILSLVVFLHNTEPQAWTCSCEIRCGVELNGISCTFVVKRWHSWYLLSKKM